MRNKVAVGCSLLFAFTLLGAQSEHPEDKCTPREDDAKGYLLKICRHIVKNKIDVSPADPNRYRIKGVYESKYEDREAYLIELDCCYMGDRAFIDKKTGEVLAFALGIK